jgi:hypothetical protein
MAHPELADLYKRARQFYEKEDDLHGAKTIFYEIIQRYPDTHEAEYAAAFVDKIEKGLHSAEQVEGPPSEEDPARETMKRFFIEYLFGIGLLCLLEAINFVLLLGKPPYVYTEFEVPGGVAGWIVLPPIFGFAFSFGRGNGLPWFHG